ncbi:MAG: DNA repair protein RadC [bacterium]
MLPFTDTNVTRALAPLLSRFRGRRAVVIAPGEPDFVVQLRHRFDDLWSLQPPDGESSEIHFKDPSTGLIGEDDCLDLAVFYWSFHCFSERACALAETLRVLKPQGRVVIVDPIPLAGNERQYTHLMLQQMLTEWNAALGKASFPVLTAEAMQRDLKAAGFHHLRTHEFLQTSSTPGTDAELKEQALGILRQEIIPSLAQLGARRAEFEKRVVELKQRLERIGIEIHPFVAVTGMKKAKTGRSQPNLFVGETDVPTPKAERRYEITAELQETELSLEERLLKFGAASLRAPELFAFLLCPGQPETVEELAERILHDYGSRAIAEEQNPYRLKDALNISLPLACQIVVMFELGRRFFDKGKAPALRSPEDVFHHLREMGTLKREQFRVLFLNPQGELLGDEIVATGNRGAARLHPRDIFARALHHRAAALILCHNHPSGDLSPSPEDLEFTQRLLEASKLMGIELLDHVIITDRAWTSFRDSGLL